MPGDGYNLLDCQHQAAVAGGEYAQRGVEPRTFFVLANNATIEPEEP